MTPKAAYAIVSSPEGIMEKFAELILDLFRIQNGGRQRTADGIEEDDQLALRIVARLRTECDKFWITEDASRTNGQAA